MVDIKEFREDVKKIKKIKKLGDECLKIYNSLDINTKNYFIDIFSWSSEKYGMGEVGILEIIELLNNSTRWLCYELNNSNIKNSDLKRFWEAVNE